MSHYSPKSLNCPSSTTTAQPDPNRLEQKLLAAAAARTGTDLIGKHPDQGAVLAKWGRRTRTTIDQARDL